MLIERPKMTRTMYQALKRNIMRERERIKQQEQEQDEAMERLKQERELRKKKQEEDSLTLEQTKEQLGQLEKRLDELKKEKHNLFSQLKKVLHQEDETKKKAQQKENDMVQAMPYPQPGMVTASHPTFLQNNIVRQARYLNPVQQNVGVKRPRSPSPPPAGGMYGGYNSGQKYPATSYANVKQEPFIHRQKFLDPRYSNAQHAQAMVKQEGYPAPTTQQSITSYQSQSTPVTGHQYQGSQPGVYQTSQSGAPKSYAGAPPTQSQSAFSSYSGHYQHSQKGLPEHYPAGYQVQRVPQPGYLGSSHGNSSLPLQQQLEHANQKSGFSEDKYKIQQVKSQAPMRGLSQGVLTSAQSHVTSNTQPPPSTASGSIVQGFPVRTTASYQPPSTQGQSSQSSVPGRSYTGQAPGRYYP